MTRWQLRGQEADRRDLAEALTLGRRHRKRIADADREARERERDARAVGRALRRGENDRSHAITCQPAPVSGSRKGATRLRGFEVRLGLLAPKRSYVSPDGFSSFHLKFTPRGRGTYRRAKDRPYRPGEAVVAVRYILRDGAREIEGGGIVSNIGRDPDTIASFFAALEELEMAGRANGNVYTSVIVSLPHELERGREALLAAICEPFRELDLPFAAVLHAPDPEGNPLNYHAHILFSWRQFAVLTDGFAFETSTLGSLNNTGFITEFRAHAAASMNRAMAAAGHSRRFTAKQRDRKGADVAQDKHSPGRKHADRRQENIALGTAEKEWVDERRGVLARARELVQKVLLLDVVDRAAPLAALARREAELVLRQQQAVERASVVLPPAPAVIAVSPVSHEKRTPPAALPENVALNASAPNSARPVPSSSAEGSPARDPAMKAPAPTQAARPQPGRTGPADQRSRYWRLLHAFPLPPAMAQGGGGAASLPTLGSLANVPKLSATPKLREARPRDVVFLGDAPLPTTTNSERDIGSGTAGGHGSSIGRHAAAATPPKSPREPTSPSAVENVGASPGSLAVVHATSNVPPVSTGPGEIDELLAALERLEILPLRRRMADNEGMRISFTVVPEEALPEDAEIARRAAAADDDRLQRFYADCWRAMLDLLRASLTVGRRTALTAQVTEGLKRKDARVLRRLLAEGWDPRLMAALRAAGPEADVTQVVENSVAYWRGRVASKLSSGGQGSRQEAARTAARGRVASEQVDGVSLEDLAAIMKNGGKGR